MKKLSNECLNVINTLRIEQTPQGAVARITAMGSGPNGMLDRALYAEFKKVMEALGGKWNRKLDGILFADNDAVDAALDNVVHTGTFVDAKKLFQFYETPPELADKVVQLADIGSGMTVLEPSAGLGRMVDALVHVCQWGSAISIVELDPEKIRKLKAKYWDGNVQEVGEIYHSDFLAFTAKGLGPEANAPKLFDRVVMNPPFTKQQDAKHVRHAYNLLKPGGRLVAIMSAAVEHRATEHYQWVRDHAEEILDVPEGAFKDSGTMVRTKIVVIDKE